MGQQQLLLLVLAAILVGIAVLLGISMFHENAAQANLNAVTQHCLYLGAQAQGWYKRPAAMAGGGQSFTGFDLTDLGMAAVDTTTDGTFTSAVISATSITITGTGNEDLDDNGTPLVVTATVTNTSASITSVVK